MYEAQSAVRVYTFNENNNTNKPGKGGGYSVIATISLSEWCGDDDGSFLADKDCWEG